MNNNIKTTNYIFNDIDTSCIAAIEYVIYKYENEEWFNAALNKVVTDVYTKTGKNICHIPFIITKKECLKTKKVILTHKGYHYIICQINKYAKQYNKNNNVNNNIFLFIICILLLSLLFILALSVWNKSYIYPYRHKRRRCKKEN